MKKSRFTESQIIKALKENEQGRSVGELSRELGIDKSTLYYWRKKYGGMDRQELKRLKELEEENSKLKQMYAVVSLDNQMLYDILKPQKPGKVITNLRVQKAQDLRKEGVSYNEIASLTGFSVSYLKKLKYPN